MEKINNSQTDRFLKLSKGYTNTYERNRRIKDWDSKEEVAKKILEDFKKRVGDPKGKRLLDVGFGNGAFSVEFARAGAEVSGIEVNPILLNIAKENRDKSGVKVDFQIYDGNSFPLEDESFDYIYSTNVAEHTNSVGLFLREINRVLKPGGLVYLSFPNRFAPKETHSGLWFISYFPRGVSEWYVKHIRGRNIISELNLHFLSYFTLLRNLKKTQLSVRFEVDSPNLVKRVFKKFLALFNIHHSILLRTIMVILEKK